LRQIRQQSLRDKERKAAEMMNLGFNGLWGVLILAGDIWAIINIFQSGTSNEKKLIWIVAVLLLPLVGLILWYFLGPRNGKA
jgi:succinate dehydrogenase/fumarate reductase cytochrome b subunit